jgi:radical SAM superfamily enzyme YgiQ (UPF0313 family)
MPFYTEASINLADDPEMMRLMREAGFHCVFIGIETPDDAGLAACDKVQNRGRDLHESVRTIQRAGIQVQAGFIVGFDSDTPEIFRKQADFINRSGIVTAMVGILQAPPGTKLFNKLTSEGRILSSASGDNADGLTNIATRMDLSTLREGYHRLMNQLYSPRTLYRRIRVFLREYQAPLVNQRMSLRHLHALGMSMWYLGVCGRERLQYWTLLAWTTLTRPRLVPTAVTLAIYGYHFRKVARTHIRC